ncbi:MAG: hypothetical protein RLZZ46_9 [Bacteroidota bacterium]
MPTVKPFKALRPVADKVHLVSSKSVDSYTSQELNAEWTFNPYSFLRIIKPSLGNSGQSLQWLHSIREKFSEAIDKGVFIQDEQAALYIYSQSGEYESYTGIIGLASTEDYENGLIRIHEQTLTDREEKLMHYLEVCDFNAEPVLMFYPEEDNINRILDEETEKTPIYHFSTSDGISHQLWKISDKNRLSNIEDAFKGMPCFYIADGHHRSASSALLARVKNKNKPDSSAAYNFYLTAFFSEKQLKIVDYNRVVKDLNGWYETDFIDALKQKFDITDFGETMVRPSALHEIVMYLGGHWYKMKVKQQCLHDEDPTGALDASLLTELVLQPLLNITDLKTDSRVGFVNGTKGMEELARVVDSGKMKAAFALHPVSLNQLKEVADHSAIMPPKSTYVKPKLRSGMLVYSLSEV